MSVIIDQSPTKSFLESSSLSEEALPSVQTDLDVSFQGNSLLSKCLQKVEKLIEKERRQFEQDRKKSLERALRGVDDPAEQHSIIIQHQNYTAINYTEPNRLERARKLAIEEISEGRFLIRETYREIAKGRSISELSNLELNQLEERISERKDEIFIEFMNKISEYKITKYPIFKNVVDGIKNLPSNKEKVEFLRKWIVNHKTQFVLSDMTNLGYEMVDQRSSSMVISPEIICFPSLIPKALWIALIKAVENGNIEAIKAIIQDGRFREANDYPWQHQVIAFSTIAKTADTELFNEIIKCPGFQDRELAIKQGVIHCLNKYKLMNEKSADCCKLPDEQFETLRKAMIEFFG